MKVKAIADFRDIETNEDIKIGDVIEVEEERATLLINNSLCEPNSILKKKSK